MRLSRYLLPCLNSSGRLFLGKSTPAVSSMSISMSMSLSSSSHSHSHSQSQSLTTSVPDAFTELEHTNWQRGVDAYTNGFGPLTSQAVSALLDRAGFFPSSYIDESVNINGDATTCCSLLDVACGPGQVIEAAISRANNAATDNTAGNSNCTYSALDFSSNFLELAKRNLKAKHPDTAVTFVKGDARVMSSVFGEHQQFDSITCNFGILHLSAPDSFLAESYKILKPGGRLAFSTWSAPPTTEGFDLILGTVRDFGNPNVELPDGPPFFRFSDPDEVVRSLEAAGFIDVETTVVESMEWTSVGDSSDKLYEVLLEGTARTRELLLGQTEAETEAIKKELKRRFAHRFSEEGTNGRRGPLRMPAVISSGRKPL